MTDDAALKMAMDALEYATDRLSCAADQHACSTCRVAANITRNALSALQLPPEGEDESLGLVGIPFAPQKEPSADAGRLGCEPSGIRFRKRPVEIEAVKWTGDNLFGVRAFIDGAEPDLRSLSAQDRWDDYGASVAKRGLIIHTLEGDHLATIGDWIIKGVKGEFYPCKPDVFAMTYEPVTDAPNAAGAAA